MAKINKEEYEILKGTDDKWKWIARDREAHRTDIHMYSDEPRKSSVGNQWMRSNHIGDIKQIDSELFQFIQWEDEEPCNIQELIEEYEENLANEIVNRQFESLFGESEETEVEKDKEWAQKEVDRYLSYEGVNEARNALVFAKGVINQLDEPEALSEEWISENVEYAYFKIDGSERLSSATAIIKPKKLKNLLVPKQPFGNSEELPKIPQWVADNIESKKRVGTRLNVAMSEFPEFKLQKELDIDEHECNEIYARAWLDGYTVDEEPKYIIDLDDEEISDGNHYLKHLEISEDGVNYRVCDSLNAMTFESEEEAQLIAEYVGGYVKEL